MPRKAKRQSPKQEAIAAYRSRFRRWTMEALPDMPADQWAGLVAWVQAFGVTAPVTGAARRRKGRTPLIAFKAEKEHK